MLARRAVLLEELRPLMTLSLRLRPAHQALAESTSHQVRCADVINTFAITNALQRMVVVVRTASLMAV